jgi:hypothetical protein
LNRAVRETNRPIFSLSATIPGINEFVDFLGVSEWFTVDLVQLGVSDRVGGGFRGGVSDLYGMPDSSRVA